MAGTVKRRVGMRGRERLSEASGTEIAVRAGRLSVAVSGAGGEPCDRGQKALLSATGGDRRILWDDAVRPHGADAICLSGDAGTAVSGGTEVRNRPEDGK